MALYVSEYPPYVLRSRCRKTRIKNETYALLDTVVWYGVHRIIRDPRRTAMTIHTIGQVARKSGVGVETVRFYEREGLIPQPPRPENGFRRYPQDAVSRIRFIQRSKALGFTLREIKDLLSLRVDSSTSCGEVKKRAEAKTAAIEGKIRHLREMKRALEKLTAACRGKGPTGECPILEALGGPDRTPASEIPGTRRTGGGK